MEGKPFDNPAALLEKTDPVFAMKYLDLSYDVGFYKFKTKSTYVDSYAVIRF